MKSATPTAAAREKLPFALKSLAAESAASTPFSAPETLLMIVANSAFERPSRTNCDRLQLSTSDDPSVAATIPRKRLIFPGLRFCSAALAIA